MVAWLRYSKAPDVGAIADYGGKEDNVTASIITTEDSKINHTIGPSPNLRYPNAHSTSPSTSLLLATNDMVSINLQYVNHGKDLPIYAVFMTVIAAMKDNAYYPATALVQPFASGTPGYDAQLSIMLDSSPQTPRIPFIRSHVTHAIRHIPVFMLEQRRFAEVGFTITWRDQV